jgi:hypothetical protein
MFYEIDPSPKHSLTAIKTKKFYRIDAEWARSRGAVDVLHGAVDAGVNVASLYLLVTQASLIFASNVRAHTWEHSHNTTLSWGLHYKTYYGRNLWFP